MNPIDGKALSNAIQDELAKLITEMPEKPALAAVLVGDDPASHLYVKLKEKACKKVGITFHKYLLEADASQEEILSVIEFLNTDPETDGILVQLPLPNRDWEDRVIEAIDLQKDVDGFHPQTLANLLAGDETIVPGLASGIVRLIMSVPEAYEAKNAVIICNTEIFSQPIEYLLRKENINATMVHSDDAQLTEKTHAADVVIIAIGRANFLTPDMVKDSAIIIDVGINKVADSKKVVGDVDFEAFAQTDCHLTPVPGGVGPMTVAMLLYNVWNIKKNA